MTDYKTERLAQFLSVLVPQFVAGLRREAGLLPLPTCVLNTRLCVAVLEKFGVAAKPRAVLCAVYNREYKSFIDAYKRWPKQGDLDDGLIDKKAWSVICKSDGTRGLNGLWNGHLVTDVQDTWILDSAVGFYNRPQHGINMPAGVPKLFRYKDVKEMVWKSPDGGSYIYYEWRDDDRLWENSPDWTGTFELLDKAVASLCKRAAAHIELPAKMISGWN